MNLISIELWVDCRVITAVLLMKFHLITAKFLVVITTVSVYLKLY